MINNEGEYIKRMVEQLCRGTKLRDEDIKRIEEDVLVDWRRYEVRGGAEIVSKIKEMIRIRSKFL